MKKRHITLNTDDSVSKYFKDVKKSKLLTVKEEIVLARRIRDGDEGAIHELVNANLKFVISIAKEYQGNGLMLSDLISEGNYGLIKAAKKFDPDRGFKFISYAVWWIKQSIMQSLNDNSRVVRLPSNVINKLSYLNKEISKFEGQNGRAPVQGEIFGKDNEVMELVSFPKHASLNDPINEDGDELIELIPGENPVENQDIVDKMVKNELTKTLSVLSERERAIVECYFGIDTNLEPMTLEAIGEKYDLTKERIRQIKEKAIRRLRHNAHNLYGLIND